ncbi:hypothetical protein FisN_11Lh330 [Fistulifera solaris]|uniref:Uncharacterized protein n=1 Tax=Fistulifera solaris TaxID=1519565 RepID=A0A1Z5K0J7_FISSO|nr:hypothetical protein FisN_11Lh330 [Fistulifera solaris]|eukprot:GAX19810.1 hypothetical protein FisN_11Lh330 [Fistulifera solaris]
MGDLTCSDRPVETVLANVVEIESVSFYKTTNNTLEMTVSAHEVPETPCSKKEESVESSVRTEALTEASFGEDVEGEHSPRRNLLNVVVHENPNEGSDAGSSLPNDSLHSFLSALFDETASKCDELDHSDEWGNEKEEEPKNVECGQQQVGLLEIQSDTLHQPIESIQKGLKEVGCLLKRESRREPSERPQRRVNGQKRSNLRQGKSDSRLVRGTVKKPPKKETEGTHPDTKDPEQEFPDHFQLKNQASLDLCDVFDSSLTSTNISSSNVAPAETMVSSGENQQSPPKASSDSLEKTQEVSPVQESGTRTIAQVNKRWNSFHGGFNEASNPRKSSTARPPREIKSTSNHGESLRSKFVKTATISSFFAGDKRKLTSSKSHPATGIANCESARNEDLPTVDDEGPSDSGLDDTERISNLWDKSDSSKPKEASKMAVHRRDELIDSIRQSLKNEVGFQDLRGPLHKPSNRQDRSKDDLLASSCHSQASYFSRSFRKLADKAKETAKVGASRAKETARVGVMLASKATVTATKTARATVMAPAYAASYVVNFKGKNNGNDPPADECNVEPIVTDMAQLNQPSSGRHKEIDSKRDDLHLRVRRSTAHRQRSDSCDSSSRKRSSSRHRTSTESTPRVDDSRRNGDADRPRHRSKSNHDKTHSRSARREREDSSVGQHPSRDRNGEKKNVGSSPEGQSQSSRRRREGETSSSPPRRNESSRRAEEERGHPCPRQRGTDEKSVATRSQSRGRSDDRPSLSQHRSRSRRRVDDSGTVASSRTRSARSVSRRRQGDLDDNSTHRTRRRGRSIRRSDPPGIAVDYEKEEKPADEEPLAREYRGRSKSVGTRRKRRVSPGR